MTSNPNNVSPNARFISTAAYWNCNNTPNFSRFSDYGDVDDDDDDDDDDDNDDDYDYDDDDVDII